jgi:hypothetical protein
MVAVREINWEEASALGFETTTRQAWREAVADIAEKVRNKLPECAGRVDSAVKIVLAGDVELLADDTAKVASQSNGTTAYHIINGTCTCRDFDKAPHQLCKHRLSAAIARRAQELVRATLNRAINGQVAAAPDRVPAPVAPEAQAPAPTAPLPEAPVSITLKATLHGHEVLVTLRGVDFASVKAQVEQASEWLSTQTPAQPAQRGEGWCGKHGVAMKLNHGKNGSTWYSHKTVDGWCKGR